MIWVVVAVVGVGTMMFKAVGPVLIGERQLPPRLARMLDLLAPAVFAALIATQTFGTGQRLVVDERLLGVGLGAIALLLKAPMFVVVVVAAASTALARAFLL